MPDSKAHGMEIFAISPASSKPIWIIGVVCVVVAVVLIALAFTAYSSRHSRVELDSERIRLVSVFWGRTIPFGALDIAGARVVDLDSAPEYAPKRRTFGTGLPGYASGWFRLRGGEKALVYLTRRRDVVYLPTSEDYALLLSVEQPERFIEALRRLKISV